MPIELQQSDYMGSISYFGQNVNINGEPFSSVFKESATESFSAANRTTKTGSKVQFSTEEYDNPLLALTGGQEMTQHIDAQDSGEHYSLNEDLSDEDWDKQYGLSLPAVDEGGNNFVDKTANNVENDTTDTLTRGEQYDNGRVREGTAETAGGRAYNRGAIADGTENTQGNQGWKNLSKEVRSEVLGVVSNRINNSSNIDELYPYVLSLVNADDATVDIHQYKKAVDILAQRLYDDATMLHPVLFEDRWKIFGGNISSLRNEILNVARLDAGNESDVRYSVDEEDNPLLALKGEGQLVDYEALESQYTAERYSAEEEDAIILTSLRFCCQNNALGVAKVAQGCQK